MDLRSGNRWRALLAAAAVSAAGVVASAGMGCIPDAQLIGGNGGGGSGGTVNGGGGTGGGSCVPDACPGVDSTCRYRVCVADACAFETAPILTACSEDGGTLCDGQGSCIQCTTETGCPGTDVCEQGQCVPATCQNGILDPNETDVDCGGDCQPCVNGLDCNSGEDCVSGYCDAGSCAPCSVHPDCAAVANSWCDTTVNGGECVPQLPTGDLCEDDAQCISNHCPALDGVCCDTACSGICEACLVGKTGSPNGTCALVTATTDPDGECPDLGAATCGSNGAGCSGTANSCLLYAQGTQCQTASCSAGQLTAASACNGNGSCVPGSTSSCAPYMCNPQGTACAVSCGVDSDCSTGNYCQGSSCVPQKTNGQACSGAGQCASGFCPADDGVCCDAACTGTCSSCKAIDTCGVDGTCSAVTSGTDPKNECAGASSCFAGACQSGTVVFVTSATYSGNLGGLAGADAICASHAQNACLTGTFLPWLSTATSSPGARFPHQTVAYRLVTGTKVADNWSDLTDITVDAPLNRDEFGAPAPASDLVTCGGVDHTDLVYTGTYYDATRFLDQPGAFPAQCDDWTATTGDAGWGYYGDTNNFWTLGCSSGGQGNVCFVQAPIYCFQQ